MLPRISRRLSALSVVTASLALLAFAPGAFAATLGVSGGVLTYTGGTGATSAIEFDETDVGTVVVHKVESGRDMELGLQNFGTFTDNDAITIGTDCDDDVDGTPGADTDANGDPIITCTGVTVGVVANPGDDNDAIDGSGTLSDDGPGLVTLPLTANLGDGDDVSIGGRGNDVIHGNVGNDNIGGDTGGPGGGSNDQLFGDEDSDALAGGSGQDVVDGGAGDDPAIIGGPGPDTLTGGDGDDGQGGPGIVGGPGPDSIDGGAGDDIIDGDCFGDPCPVGGEGADVISGGSGFDDISGDGGNDTISGGDDGDGIIGGAGDDTIHGDAGNDDVFGDCDGCGGSVSGNDTLFGDAGNDDVRGQGGDDTADGGADNDFVAGGQGTDNVSGGDGDDDVYGSAGNDTASGGAGDDYVTGDCGGYLECGDGTDGNDTVNGDAGQDFIEADLGSDVQNGGTGIDELRYADRYYDCTGPCVQTSHPVSVTLDGAANDGGPGENDAVNEIEDVSVEDSGCCGSDVPEGGSTLVGDAGVNALNGSEVSDTITGGDGNDFLFGNGGDDTLNANDGFADRVSCGDGTDVANVDEFDQVADDCETVNRTTRGALATEDAPPTVAWVSPASGATMSTSKANTLTVNATDDKGISQVVFLAGERVVCTDTAAPYTCDYKPSGDEVGKVTLTAVAVDTRQQQASALRTVKVGRFAPTKVSAKTTPKKDASLPFTFTTKGTVSLPAGVTKAVGCSGKVSVTFKSGKKTVSTHRTSLKKSCSYKSKVTFRLPGRLHPKKLQVVVRYQGNAVLTAKSAKRTSVKTA